MRSRRIILIVCLLLLAAGAWFFWPHAKRVAVKKFTAPIAGAFQSAAAAPQIFHAKSAFTNSAAAVAATKANPFPYRLSNTRKTIGELANDRRAILLDNALIETGAKLNLPIPKNLQAQGDPGAYIVQAGGPIGAEFRAMLAAAGAQIVSYIPNNAYLVRISAGGASSLAANPLAQSVIPYEPYYKVQSPLLAFDEKPLPAGAVLNLGLFTDNPTATIQQIEKLGGKILSQDISPFGPVVRVQPPSNWTALAVLPGVQIVEANHSRKLANDLSRVTTGVATDTTNAVNYDGLTGRNVVVAVPDSGIDATHPDFATGRVIGDAPQSLVDTDGHGTHVAGIIAGNGSKSLSPVNVGAMAEGSVSNADFRGKAPLATLYSIGGVNGADTNPVSDRYFQEAAARTNALIENDSWGYGGDNAYDLAAASYDAAVRDALSGVSGSQPVLFVFAVGNDGHIGKDGGNGNDDGGGGTPDSITSPATAKDVISVGALEQLRNITNLVTALDGTSNAVWKAATDSSSEVADYSSRGNVGIGTEGTFGRYKPDVVAPGSFVISTRSQQWDEQAYYNPTNFYINDADDQFVDTNALNYYTFPFVVQNNAVGVSIQLLQNALSPNPFPTDMPIYVSLNNFPDPADPATFDFETTKDNVTIPPDGGGGYLQSIINNFGSFNFGVGDSQSFGVNYDLRAEMITTNDLGNYYTVLSNLNDTLGPYYRYESGTSMAAAEVSGVLALMQDFFTNTLHTVPSPALLKAMLINGARPTGFYNFQVDNPINLEGWGLINLPNSIPAGLTNTAVSVTNTLFFVDQSPTNALATGDTRTYQISLSPGATTVPLRLTLAWTDPPGNPAAAIKLVNNLDLIVTNTDSPTNLVVYYGNDIGANQVFNTQENPTNSSPNLDNINNVQNVFLPANAGTNFTVVIYGATVNVNAVTAQTTDAAGNFAPNIVQDFAFVMSSGNGSNTNGFAITGSSASSNPTGGQRITDITGTNASPLLNQFVGANSPLVGTNIVFFPTNSSTLTNEQVVIGETNQWHFYVWTNYCGANAAFVTFLPPTLAVSRGNVFADSAADSAPPEADIDLYVTTDPNLTNLNPNVIFNCITNPQVGASVGAVFNGSALGRGGSEFVVDTNSAAGRVYYIGVKSEAQMASEYSFLGICSETPFSGLDSSGNEYAGFYPVEIPDGDATHPGFTNSLALTIYPVQVQRVVITNTLTQQNAGDLVISVNHSTVDNGNNSVVLLNHDSPQSGAGTFTDIYDDSGEGDIVNSQPSDGPGSLDTFVGQSGMGIWLLHASDNAPSFIGSIQGNLKIEPHQPLGNGVTNTVAPGGWFYDFIDVPDGFSTLNVFATNVSATPIIAPPLELFLNIGAQPTLTDFLLEADLTNPPALDPGNSIIYGPPLQPGRYWVGVFNPSSVPQQVFVLATLTGNAVAPQQTDFDTNGPALIDDALTTNSIFVSATNAIVSVNVGLVVNHPRISDLSFTLVSPTGQRVLLMENRGGLTATNFGDEFISTNSIGTVNSTGDASASTNFIDTGKTSGQLTISYDFFSVPDEMTVYYGTNSINFTLPNALYDSGMVSGTNTVTVNFGPGASTFVTIIMNQFGNTNATGDAWNYTAGDIEKVFNYLTFTEDTNLTEIPIKFAVPPYDLDDFGTNFTLADFESATPTNYFATNNIFDTFGGWNVPTNQITDTNLVALTNELIFSNEVSIVTDPATAQTGSNYLALADGTISRVIPLTIGRQFSLTYRYRGPGISGWWRGEGNATDSSDPENNGNNGSLIGRFDFPAGEVGQAFQMEDAGADFEFAGTNTYVQIRQSPSLNVGTNGFTVEGWINPTNLSHQEPLVEWLSQMPTNGSDTNLAILAGPFLDRATSHYYYLLRSTNWTTSENWATQLGGHLATIDTANEENWVFDTFANYGGTNRNLWVGLTNSAPGRFGWSSGLTNIVYTNWANAQPTNCDGTKNFTAILNISPTNQPGLWFLADNNGFTCDSPARTNVIYGVVEVNNLQTNGVRFWISVTNSPGTTNSLVTSNGCLYANLVDVSNVSHEIFSAPGLVQSNIFQHVALTYNTNSGIANLYYDGTNVASSNLTVFVPKTTGDVLLGKDMSLDTNNFYAGKMDEMSIYSRALSDAEIRAIYEISNLTTNRNTGKFDPAVTPAEGLAEAKVSLGGMTNTIFGENGVWQEQGFSFTAISNSLPLKFTGVEPGILLDSFAVSEAPVGNLYYLPEQSLAELTGSNPFGNWTLEILDNRTGAVSTNAQLVNWQLQFVLQTNVFATPIPLPPQDPTTITIPPGQIVYLSVAVPTWANFATNILVSSTAPVDLLANTNPPTGSNPGDVTLLPNSTGGVGNPVLSVAPPSTPPLRPGQTYFLGVKNSGAHAATAVVEVDFDITVLTNGIPLTSVLTTNDPVRYFAFDVSSNAFEATFQLLQLSSNADLVVRKGAPLPTLFSSDYGSFNATNADENIYVLTNSSPVPLSAGRWYLGVVRRDAGPVNYTVLAKELDVTNGMNGYKIIDLTNGVPFNFTAGPGAALTNFFRFNVTNTVNSTVTNLVGTIHFELYNMSGNGDLTVESNAPPFAPPFFQSSQNPGRTDELIDIRTNSALTNLAASWYLGVPNNETNLITYTILALIDTNAVFPAFPGAEGAGAGALGGRGGDVYHVLNLNDDGFGSLRYGITSFIGNGAGNTPGTGTTNFADPINGESITNFSGARTIVFDVSGTIELLSPLLITNSYLTIAGQTSPNGITVAGDLTTIQSAHDVVIRYVRFRPSYLIPSGPVTNTVVALSDGFEGATATNYVSGVNPAFNTWTVTGNQVSRITDTNVAYAGSNLLALADGVISNTLPTVTGQTYTLSFAYRGPGIVGWWRGENNLNDSINANNGTGGNGYTSGEVGQAFVCNGSKIEIPDKPIFVLTNSLSIEGWVKPTGSGSVILWRGDSRPGFDPYTLAMQPGNEIAFAMSDQNNNTAFIQTPLVLNTWSHVAGTWNGSSGAMKIYVNGALAVQTNTPNNFIPANLIAGDDPELDIGAENNNGFAYIGDVDELSLYARALSASEIQAIYNLSSGKFDATEFNVSPASSLAEAQITVNGSSSPAFFGSNTVWRIYTNTFIATSNSTPLIISGIRPGMLIDAVSLTTSVAVNADPSDSLKMTNVSDVVADHISASWSTNEIVSALNSSNVTVQWSVLADSLNNTNAPHGYGSLLRYGNGMLSFHHNLYADNYNASPRLGDNLKLDFVNNVVYDWGTNAGFSTNETLLDDPSGFTNELNYECNYLIAGSNSVMTNIAFFGGSTNTWIFQTNNFMDSNKNKILDGDDIGWNMFTNLFTETNRPFNSSSPTIDEAFLAYERVQDFAGVSMGQRDLFDTNIVGRVRAQTGAIISTAPLSGLVAWWRGENNANDFVGTNNGILEGAVGFTNGEVDQAFYLNSASAYVDVPASSSLNVGATNGFTIEMWIKPQDILTQHPLAEWSSLSGTTGSHFWISVNLGGGNGGSGCLYANLVDTGNNSHQIFSAAGLLQSNVFQHVALTYDKTTGNAVLYCNGSAVKTTNLGIFTPQTSYDLLFGHRISTDETYPGVLDEISIYNRVLSANEIQFIYSAGTGGKLFISSTPPPLDTDRDGIPDYWETTLGESPTNFSANADRNLDGYTDLEEYMNWLAAPHALTATNAPVGVDLYTLCGKTGKLSFSLTNAVNGSVYLTNVLGSITNIGTYSNSIAVFTPTNNFIGGFASFGFFVTNNDTVANFGPVTVSVMDSAVPVLFGSVTALTNSASTTASNIINAPLTNSVVLASNSIAYFSIFAPTNADFASNILLNASGTLNFWFNQNLLPSGSNPGDFELLTNKTAGSAVLGTNGAPSFVPGETYYLALQNTNSFAVTNYAVQVNFHLLFLPSVVVTPPVNPVFTGVSVTGGNNVQLQWIASPDTQVEVQWTTNLASPILWNTITNPAATTSNGVSTFTDDGSQTAPFGEERFYRLVQTSP